MATDSKFLKVGERIISLSSIVVVTLKTDNGQPWLLISYGGLGNFLELRGDKVGLLYDIIQKRLEPEIIESLADVHLTGAADRPKPPFAGPVK